MALEKSITQEDGVVTHYHRILYIQNVINKLTSITIVSYAGKTARMSEIEGTTSPYKAVKTYEIDYIDGITPDKAYEYLKTLEEFKDAEDV